MTKRGSSSSNSKRVPRGFRSALTSAALEWLLIFMLYVHAVFSYIITEFAYYSELQVPCLLCSRLDHLIGNKRGGFYWDLICGNHKLEISSLVLCHAHNKLADVHGICESCLFSFATINKSNAETYRLLVGKLGEEPEDSCTSGSSKTKHCSCCNGPWVSKGYTQEFLRTRSLGSDDDEQKHLTRKNDRSTTGASVGQFRENRPDPLSHVEYVELKIHSDTETEAHFSDVDTTPLIPEMPPKQKQDVMIESTIQPHTVTLGEDPEDLSREDFTSGSSKTKRCSYCNAPWASRGYTQKLLRTRSSGSDDDDDQNNLMRTSDRSTTGVSPVQFGENRPDPLSHVEYVELNIDSDTEMEARFSDVDTIPFIAGMPERKQDVVIECTSQPCIVTPADELVSEKMVEPVFEPEPSPLLPKVHSGDIIADVATSGTPNVAVGHGLEELNWQQAESNAEHSRGTELISFDDGENALFTERESMSKLGIGPLALTETGPEIKTDTAFGSYLELGDAYKLAVSNKGRQFVDKQVSMSKSPRVSEDFRILLSQLSTARGIDLPIPDMSPRVYGHNDDEKRISFERNSSGFESLDGSVISEIEGETVLSRCKRQIDHDRKLLGSLYRELEEERNASSVAANQAMAMITRLQEEKAEIHMEALQYLRMMEEQSEYDMEALQRVNDQLVEKEKEIQDLEAELESYKTKAPSFVAEAEKPIVHRVSRPNKPLLAFEDEKLYISNYLEKLEERIHLFSNNGAYPDIGDGAFVTKYEHDGLSESSIDQEHDGSPREEIPTSENSREHKEVKRITSLVFGENDLAGLGNVVSDLHNRFKALEADRDFLEMIINTLKSGDEGLDFIQEIASHLRELRRIGVRINGEDFS